MLLRSKNSAFRVSNFGSVRGTVNIYVGCYRNALLTIFDCFFFLDRVTRTGHLRLKQRVVTEFLAKEGCAVRRIHNRLKKLNGGAGMNTSNTQRWMKKFQ